MTYDAIVVGAGITGAATAFYLKTCGLNHVLLVDKSGPAAGGTGKSAAIIRQHYSNKLAADLSRETIAIFKGFESVTGYSCGFSGSGYHMLVPSEMLDGAEQNVKLLQSMGIETTIEAGETACSKFEWLNSENVKAIVNETTSGFADPVRATEAFVSAYTDLGGKTRFKANVSAFLGDAEKVCGIVVDGDELSADVVVNAAGPWAGPLGESVGLEMPLTVYREQDTVWEVRPDRPIPDGPVSNAVDAIYLRPLGNRRFVVGRGFPKEYVEVDPNNYDEVADQEFVSDVLSRLEHRFPSFQGAKLIDSYASLYDVTPDWYPFAGPRQGTEGYIDAWGGSGHGFKLAPAISRRLADWIVTGSTDDQFRRLSHDRLARNEVFVQKYGGNRG